VNVPPADRPEDLEWRLLDHRLVDENRINDMRQPKSNSLAVGITSGQLHHHPLPLNGRTIK